MKYRYLLLLIVPFLLNCPKRMTPGARHTIEIYYFGSLTEDLARKDPFLAATADLKGVKVGYLDTDKPGYALFLQKIGLYKLFDDLSLDFLVTNCPAYGENYLPVLKTMGYGLKNIEGVRFAILSLGKDSLTIHDQTRISLARERSDVLWVIEKKVLDQPPFKMNFLVRNRVLLSASQSKFNIKPDPERIKRIAAFYGLLTDTLNVPVDLGNQTLAEFVLSRMARKTGAGAILYPADFVSASSSRSPITVRDLLNSVQGEITFVKKEMTGELLLQTQTKNNYLLWGKVGKTNPVLVPVSGGDYVLDLLLN